MTNLLAFGYDLLRQFQTIFFMVACMTLAFAAFARRDSRRAYQDNSNAVHRSFFSDRKGGSMPKLICDVLKSIDNFEWKRVRLFMVDERIVPVTDAESNYGQYLANLPAECHQYIVPVEIAESASKTALQYESTLRATLCPEQIGRLPRFDMLFLGMGPDGHTCSLFPGHRLLQKNDLLTWVVAVTDSPKPPSQRISLTLPVLNAAKNVAFIITGEDKASMVKTVLESDVQHVPASFVKPFSKKLRFFLDKGAASKL